MTLTSATPSHARMPSSRKIGWILGLALASTLPSVLISQLIGEREDRATTVRDDIVKAWGPEQRISGPKLVLPVTDKDGKRQYLSVAPRLLDVKAVVVPTTRRRGLFAVTVYEASVVMRGSFDLPEGFRDGGPDASTSGPAIIAVGMSGTQGVLDDDRAEVAGVKQPWQACADALSSGCALDTLVADADVTKIQGAAVPFNLILHFRGTGTLRIASAAKHATTHIEGAWPTPSFVGSDLPTTSTASASGFEAQWTQDRIGQPHYLKGLAISGYDDKGSLVGVDLIEGTPVYRTITRGSKYALLIVALAFATYFLFEVSTGVSVALFQYGMLGASLSLFTLLLLSISEIVGYGLGYWMSATLVTVQASLYTLAVTRRPGPTAAFAALLATVFGFFYVLLGLESFALVIGTVGLFVVLSIVMGVTEIVAGADAARAPAAADTGIVDAKD